MSNLEYLLAQLLFSLFDKSLAHPTLGIFSANPLVVRDLLTLQDYIFTVLKKDFSPLSLHFLYLFFCKPLEEGVSEHFIELGDFVCFFMLSDRVFIDKKVYMIGACLISLLKLIVQNFRMIYSIAPL